MDYIFDLGAHTRAVSTSSKQAQQWFDLGLNWLYGFNQEEAVLCFQKTLEQDPDCAMAHWGAAYAAGPFYNMAWELFCPHETVEMLGFCHGHVQQALALAHNASPVEQALIGALANRFQRNQPATLEDYACWDDAYADAMREVYRQYPQDGDVAALFAEAMMTRTPWKLWDLKTGEVAGGADTLEVIEVLESAIVARKQRGQIPHPGIHHMYLHALEMSPDPERALGAADELCGLQPDAGHLNHMPAHIYALCGRYDDALKVSETAIAADHKYVDYAGTQKFYTTAICHDLHMKMHAAMMSGLFTPAIEAAEEITVLLTDELLRVDKPYMAMTLEGYFSMHQHVLVRFGCWQQIIDSPMPEDTVLYCVTTAMCHYARGIAHAALGHIETAEQEKELFRQAVEAVPEQRYFFNNYSRDLLAIGESMLAGELEYHKGNYDQAFYFLRQAVQRNDDMHYSEPWPWMHPPRHALGALLLEQGYVDEALQVYREDLGLDSSLMRAAQHPGNVWSLHGYLECLLRRGDQAGAQEIRQQLEQAQSITDVPIKASCCCRG